MTYIIIGLIVGLVMGLTGAGGALISIPMFLYLLNLGLKEATILSLVAVIFGTGMSLIGQLTKIDKKIVIGFSVFGFIGNFASLPLKEMVSDLVIAGILSVIGIYSIVSVWKKESGDHKVELSYYYPKLIFTGLFIGLITTLTGLGGGVILVPILINFFGKNHTNALPTSLATILIVSTTSLLMQTIKSPFDFSPSNVALIGLGALLSFVALKFLIKKMNAELLVKVRKIIFTLVTTYSVVSILIRTL